MTDGVAPIDKNAWAHANTSTPIKVFSRICMTRVSLVGFWD